MPWVLPLLPGHNGESKKCGAPPSSHRRSPSTIRRRQIFRIFVLGTTLTQPAFGNWYSHIPFLAASIAVKDTSNPSTCYGQGRRGLLSEPSGELPLTAQGNCRPGRFGGAQRAMCGGGRSDLTIGWRCCLRAPFGLKGAGKVAETKPISRMHSSCTWSMEVMLAADE